MLRHLSMLSSLDHRHLKSSSICTSSNFLTPSRAQCLPIYVCKPCGFSPLTSINDYDSGSLSKIVNSKVFELLHAKCKLFAYSCDDWQKYLGTCLILEYHRCRWKFAVIKFMHRITLWLNNKCISADLYSIHAVCIWAFWHAKLSLALNEPI